MNLPAYRKYKASRAEWLDDMPADWTETRLKRVASIQTGLTLGKTVDPDDAIDLPYLRVANVQAGSLDLTEVKKIALDRANVHQYLLRPGDVLMTEGGDIDKLGRGCLWSGEIELCVHQNHIFAVRCLAELCNRFLVYILDSPVARDYFYITAKKTTNLASTNSTTLANFAFPLPPVVDQWKIVDYLDAQCADVDKLIAKQNQLIATLHEDRIVAITHAVTRGLDPRVEMKDSGLAWVREVPRDWQVVNIRRVAQMKTGHTPSRSIDAYWVNTTIPWFTLADVWQLRDGTRTYLGETSNCISELGLANSAAELLPVDTVVLSRTASVGFTGIMPTPMATSQDYWNWICGPQLYPEYLMYVFRAMRNYFSAVMMGSTHQTIYQADAAAIQVPLPPVLEQQGIAQRIFDEVAATDALCAKANEVIKSLREYRSTLIYEAVTGKIDVRQAV